MIYILWPTIRPYTFIKVYKIWIDRISNTKNLITHVCVNNQLDSDIVKSVLSDSDKVIILNSTRRGVCEPACLLSSSLNANGDDIIILASDDFTPPLNWDRYLINKLQGKTGGLILRDGYQLPDSSNMLYPCVTIPIMSYGCLLKLNKIIYHTAYFHMFSDVELYMNLKDLGLLIDDRMIDTTTFEHHHYAAGKRQSDQFDQSYNLRWKEDEITWNKRKLMPVEERIKI
jgi:hypothetical protein